MQPPDAVARLGARYEHVKALSTGNIVGADNDRIVPRLALTYDVLGNGNHVAHVSFSQYSGRRLKCETATIPVRSGWMS